ncbi:ribonucleoside-diphosphate reductase 2 subunit alpha domain protein, partial [Escherichia coli STEC_94C]
FYTITWHALRTSMLLARERGETFAGFKQSSHVMPVVNISANICKGTGSRKRRKLANCLPVAVLRYLPVRCGRNCATT